MCRDRLFFDAERDNGIDDMAQEDMEQWLALREDGDMGDMNESAIRGDFGDEEMQDIAQDNEMDTGRRSDQVEAMLVQGKTE